MAEANRISSMLNTVLGADRFGHSRRTGAGVFPPVLWQTRRSTRFGAKISTVRWPSLKRPTRRARSGWSLGNSATRRKAASASRSHEFGHYILHRHQQDLFECGDDIETGDNNERDIEAEADLFASTLLMPLDDFGARWMDQPISFDLLDTAPTATVSRSRPPPCAGPRSHPNERHTGQSRRSHAVGQVEQGGAPGPAPTLRPARNTIELPHDALAHSNNLLAADNRRGGAVLVSREPASMQDHRNDTGSGQYDC